MITLRKLLAAFILLQALAVAIQAQAPEASSTKTGVITGIVTSSSGDLPTRTTVYASPLGGTVPPQTAVINSNGAFRIENLEIGVYRVWAGASGFVVDPQSIPPETRGIYHTGDSVTLTLRKGGVITGRVLKNDAPVIATPVRAFRVRDENGKPTESLGAVAERMTDDRGVYRMYTLLPGTYVVSAGGMSRFFGGFGTTAYDQDVPTYAPSATRDTAQEVVVRSGEEATADIQYRAEPGHAISGTVSGFPDAQGAMSSGGTVTLTDVKTRTMLMGAQASMFTDHTFVFYGLPDGEYELVGQQFSATRDVRASEPKRIKVQGADITGVHLTVVPLPAITGRVILDSSSPADCVKRRATAFQETVVSVRRQKKPTKPGAPEDALADAVPLSALEQGAEDVPDAKGDFILRNLRAGTYRLNVQLPSAAWYFRSVALGANTKATDWKVVSEGVNVKQSVSGLTVTISEGAAGLRGRITVAEGQRLPSRTVVYLVPAEKENALNLLRYFEARVESDGAFNIRNVVPGDYLIHARAAEGDTPRMISIREDLDLRTTVTREAEKAKQSVTLKACERLENYEFAYPPAKP
ncbi:MAG TPA: carboxypeptidase-like regulatory domain-containing protein [Pyrinomonadaceae bacterium]|nr:carboxypeptidase-like regulatory domain-containing protein [Pyrinomonadaceae bacterium]